MAQGQIGKAGFFYFRRGNGAIPALPRRDLTVENTQANGGIVSAEGRAVQARALLGGGEGRPGNRGVQLRQGYRPGRRGGENMHIFRPGHGVIAAAGGVKIMVARGQKNLAPKSSQGQGQGLSRLTVKPIGVEKVSGQQHHIRSMVVAPVHQAAHRGAALLPAQGSLPVAETGKGAV